MRVALTAGVALAGACAAFGQAAASVPAFDVASVKASAGMEGPGRGRQTITPSPGGVSMTNVPLKAIVQWAYHVQAIQVTGPGWIDSNRYDIVAKASGPATDEELRAMTQGLLAQRFKLALHKETKEMPAYIVSVAKGGHKMTQSVGEGEMKAEPSQGRMVVHFTHVTLAQLAEIAQSPLQGVVVDQTGLKGQWDFTLDASTFAMQQPTGIEDMINMLIQAVNEQLGIRIEQKKAPAEILVVDRAEKIPVEN